MQKTQATVKISGDKNTVLEIVQKIESVFPLFVEGKLKNNDPEPGVHIFLTIVLETEEEAL